MDEEIKTEFGEFLDEFLTRYNLPAYRRPPERMELFDTSVWYFFPDEVDDEEDELGKIFDRKYADMTKEVA